MERLQEAAQVKSHIPGRVRLKLPAHLCSAASLCALSDKVQAQQGVEGVATNRDAGSMTVTYDPGRHSMSGILDVLRDLDVVIGEVAGEETGGLESGGGGSGNFLEAVEDLNGRIAAATGVQVDLKLALPLALLGMGVWRALTEGLKLQRVPALLFFWGAFDTFVRLHPAPRRFPPGGETRQPPRSSAPA